MPIFLIAVVAIIVIVIAGIVLAKGTAVFDQAVQQNRVEIEKAGTVNEYNMALTMGYKIPVTADYATQVQEARKLAAKRAAAMPRGANNGIGRLGQADEFKTAWQGVENDPMTAVKIAAYHGWDGLRTGFVSAPPQAAAPAAAAPEAAGEIELVPGKDYPVIEITDNMSPADVRKARIANAKAKSAAKKAATAAAPAAVPATAAPAAAAPAPAPAAVNVPEPELIEITDDMPPDEVRKARIANSKAKSAYKKALKAAGVDPSAAAAAPAAAPVAEAAPEPAAPPTNAPPPPELIEITDDMEPAAIRQARIANSKAKSAYKKALKAAGIDPQSVEI